MSGAEGFPYDRIGPWSETKLEIIRKYANAFTTVTSARKLCRVYIDGFAGAGRHVSRETGEEVPGSPLRVLSVKPPFNEYHLVDLDAARIGLLRAELGSHRDVHLYCGDCNQVLVDQVLPTIRYEDYKRAFCLLDPYGLHLEWPVLEAAARQRTVDVLINFPIHDINRNLKRSSVSAGHEGRMLRFWGDDTWRDTLWTKSRQLTLFGDADDEKACNWAIVDAYRDRLRTVAGFRFTSSALPMRNSKGATVYYLVAASANPTAIQIMNDILGRYGSEG